MAHYVYYYVAGKYPHIFQCILPPRGHFWEQLEQNVPDGLTRPEDIDDCANTDIFSQNRYTKME